MSALLDKLQWDAIYCEQLIPLLESSTQTYICVKDRKQLGNLLRELKLHWPDYRISIRPVLEQPIKITGDPQWPVDIANYLDLNTALSSTQMRRDVTTYLHYVMSIASGGKVGYKVSYNIPDAEPDETVQQFYPIRIYTDNAECTTRARELFAAESETLKQRVCNLLPTDLVCVETTAQALSAGVKCEMYLTSGCPWKVGTLGGVLQCNSRPYGVTAQHVQKCFQKAKTFEVVDDLEVVAALSQDVDFAFFPLPDRKVTDDAEEGDDGYMNLVAFSSDETTLNLGERVFKVGRSTGWTEGKLSSLNTDYYCVNSCKLFTSHIEVLWTDNQLYAATGDCGALYCVKRGRFYVPIAIHRVSALAGGFSYGTDFRTALAFFQPEEEKYFRNPPMSNGWEADK
ncbi:hypothetical protein EON65_52910 [archaeon]|nr:MAG: hypothetical protein EON65_52910 [archaeon]